MEPRRVLLAVTGGIAAYKVPELVRALTRSGASVRCVLTQNAAQFVSPLVQLVGMKWAEGELTIRHEHMVTEVIHDALRAARMSLVADKDREVQPDGPHLILATLPDERHGLGLEMVHLLGTLAGGEVLLLGVDLPIEEIVMAAKENPTAAVGLSVSMNAHGATTDKQLQELVAQLPEGQQVLVGGAGARISRRRVPGVTYLEGLTGFEDWLRQSFSFLLL